MSARDKVRVEVIVDLARRRLMQVRRDLKHCEKYREAAFIRDAAFSLGGLSTLIELLDRELPGHGPDRLPEDLRAAVQECSMTWERIASIKPHRS